MSTLFVSGRDWTPRKLANACRRHGITLTGRGEVIFDGTIVGSYELAGGALVVSGLAPGSPVIAALDLRQAE